jgi:membrane protein DedA with SNARE-associated domain
MPLELALISIPAGLAKMSIGKFVFYTTLGAGLWDAILAAIGYYLASVVPYEQLDSTVEEYSGHLKIVMLLVGAAAVAYLIYKGYKK